MAGVPWGLSLAAGIIITVLSLNPQMKILNHASLPTSMPLPVEARAPETGETPVDVLTGSRMLAILDEQEDSAKAVLFALTGAASKEGWIVFCKGGFIWIMDADGENEKRLTDSPIPPIGQMPTCSPDGSQIAFSRFTDKAIDSDIYIMNADGSNIRRLTDGPEENDIYPAWSPDGKRIAFQRVQYDPLVFGIYIVNADGSGVKLLVGGDKTKWVGGPEWSPDGTKIAYWCKPADARRTSLWVMDADGKNQKMLHRRCNQFAGDWSPDGDKIVFVVDYNIYVVNADGTGLNRLTQPGPMRYRSPTWSPDGTKIAFCAAEGDNDNDDIYVMDADGSNVQQLIKTPEVEKYLDWTAFSHAVDPAGKLPTTWGKTKFS
jgi:Tol biopolymer transport system component